MRERPRREVRLPAGRIRHDDGHRLRGKWILRESGARGEKRHDGGKCTSDHDPPYAY
jgi:hypothetical protein